MRLKIKKKTGNKTVKEISNDFPEDIIDTLNAIGRTKSDKSQNYQDAVKLINARIVNLESNLHIEIDMERIEDKSKALSYIGIEIAEALNIYQHLLKKLVILLMLCLKHKCNLKCQFKMA